MRRTHESYPSAPSGASASDAPSRSGRGAGRALRYPPGMASPPLFADDNSAYRRAVRKAEREAREKARRRSDILATLRRLKDEA